MPDPPDEGLATAAVTSTAQTRRTDLPPWTCLPEFLKDRRFYEPDDIGAEREIRSG